MNDWWKYTCLNCGACYVSSSPFNPAKPEEWHSQFCPSRIGRLTKLKI